MVEKLNFLLGELKELFIGSGERVENVRETIRQYNNAMSFVPFNVKVDLTPNYDPYTFRITLWSIIEFLFCIPIIQEIFHMVSYLFSNLLKLMICVRMSHDTNLSLAKPTLT